MRTNSSRRTEISALNVLFCLLVIFIHSTSATLGELDGLSWQYAAVMLPWRLSAFVVQGFLLLSGVKLFLKPGLNLKTFYLSRLKSVVLPYLAWVVIYYLFFWAKHYYPFSLRELVRYALVGDLVAHFYFIIVIVQFYVLAPLWKWAIPRMNPIIGISFALLLSGILGQYLPNFIDLIVPDYYFPYTDRIFTTYLVYWVAGCYIGQNYDAFLEILRKNRGVIVGMFALCALGDGLLSWLHLSGRKTIGFLESVHTAYVISAIVMLYMLAAWLFEQREQGNFLPVLDRGTYGVYLLHCLVIFVVNDLLGYLAIPSSGINYLLRLVGAYGISWGLVLGWNFLTAHLGGLFKGGSSGR